MSTIKKIFLASSSELADDRVRFRLFIGEKNNEWVPKGVFLEVIVWEDFLDALSPTRLQDEYNRQIRACDVFVMLFWSKVGRYTEEEFSAAVGQFQASLRPFVYTYFKTAPLTADHSKRADLQSLWAFQDKLKALGHYQTEYANTDQLLLHFSQQLDKLVDGGFIQFPEEGDRAGGCAADQLATNSGGLVSTGSGNGATFAGPVSAGGDVVGRDFVQIIRQSVFRSEDPAEAQSVIAHYLDALARELAGIKLGGIDPAASDGRREPLQLADVYVPLDSQLRIPASSSLADWLARRRRGEGERNAGEQPDEELRAVSLLEALAQHRELGALIVFDGLDECGSEARRQRVVAAVEELMRSAGKRCRFVLTARPYAWPGGAQPEAGVYALAELDKAQIAQFIGGWYAALVRRAWLPLGEAERKRDDLLAASERPDLLPLARNPLLLTLMTTLHANRGRLPDDRADLYDESVELLLLRWNQQIGADRALLEALDTPGIKLSDLRAVLERLAFEVHQEDSGSGTALLASNAEAPSHSAEIGEGRLLAAFRPLLNDDHNKAAIVVDYIEKRAGLLVGQGERAGERKFVFPHRTFQEFLAACYLTTRSDFAARCRALALAAPGHWQVVLPLAARIAKAERGASAADRLICCQTVHEFRRGRQPQAAEWACAVLAGLQLLEIGMAAMRMDAGTNAIARRVAGWLVELLPIPPQDGGLPAQQRALAGDILAQLGDPRFDAQRLFLPADDWLGFVHIAADADFRIGTRRADSEKVRRASDYSPADYERNDQPTPTPEFYFGRYLVTVAQFRAFVEATGHELHDARALHDAENRPVRRVTWYEAVKYCEWLHERLHSDGAFADLPLAALVRAQGW